MHCGAAGAGWLRHKFSFRDSNLTTKPTESMYGIFTYILLFCLMLNVGKYTIHGCYGKAPKTQKRFEGKLVFLVAEGS